MGRGGAEGGVSRTKPLARMGVGGNFRKLCGLTSTFFCITSYSPTPPRVCWGFIYLTLFIYFFIYTTCIYLFRGWEGITCGRRGDNLRESLAQLFVVCFEAGFHVAQSDLKLHFS